MMPGMGRKWPRFPFPGALSPVFSQPGTALAALHELHSIGSSEQPQWEATGLQPKHQEHLRRPVLITPQNNNITKTPTRVSSHLGAAQALEMVPPPNGSLPISGLRTCPASALTSSHHARLALLPHRPPGLDAQLLVSSFLWVPSQSFSKHRPGHSC